jgi:hypothetical protein
MMRKKMVRDPELYEFSEYIKKWDLVFLELF